MKALLVIAGISWIGMWFTPDQHGARLFKRGDFKASAEAFQNPLWQGAALYRAGEFEDAAQSFARIDSVEADYNQGNAWLMNGKYETSIACYDRVLAKRPDWKEARENRDLAIARKAMTKITGGDLGDQKLGADKIVFDKKKDNKGQDTIVTDEQAASNGQMQALWLRRVQTRPADFLKAKFSHQHEEGEGK